MAWMYRLVPKLPKSMRPRNMIILHHTGRRSGKPRVTGLQRILHDSDMNTSYVAAAYGPTSDWWRNAVVNPRVSIEDRAGVVEATAAPVAADVAVEIMKSAIREDPRLRDQAFKHAKVALSDHDGIAKVVATNPLMAFRTIESEDS